MKYLALACAMSVTASAGVVEGYLSRRTNLFNLDRSTHIRILSEFFFGVTTIAWCTPFSGFDHWGYDSLAGEQVDFILAICIRDGARCRYTEGVRIFREGLFFRDGVNLSIEN